MSLADAAAFESEFQSIAVTTVWLLELELIQLAVQEWFYYFNPTIGHARMLWAWSVFGMTLATATLLAVVCGCLFACFMVRRNYRRMVLMICYGTPLMLLQVAVWETFLDYFPGEYPDRPRLISLNVAALVGLPVTYSFCWMFCNWCDCIWKSAGNFMYTRLPITDSVRVA